MTNDDKRVYIDGNFTSDAWMDTHLRLITHNTPNLHIFTTQFDASIPQHQRESFINLLRSIGVIPILYTNSLWLIPVNSETHWMLIAVNFKHREIYQIDSLPPHDDATANIRHIIAYLYGITLLPTSYPPVPRQRILSNDCGQWVLTHVQNIVYQTPSPSFHNRETWRMKLQGPPPVDCCLTQATNTTDNTDHSQLNPRHHLPKQQTFTDANKNFARDYPLPNIHVTKAYHIQTQLTQFIDSQHPHQTPQTSETTPTIRRNLRKPIYSHISPHNDTDVHNNDNHKHQKEGNESHQKIDCTTKTAIPRQQETSDDEWTPEIPPSRQVIEKKKSKKTQKKEKKAKLEEERRKNSVENGDSPAKKPLPTPPHHQDIENLKLGSVEIQKMRPDLNDGNENNDKETTTDDPECKQEPSDNMPVNKKRRKKKGIDITIMTQNAKGVPHQQMEDKLLPFFEEQRVNKVQIVGMSETNLNWHSERIYHKVRRIFQYSYVRGYLMTATSPITTSIDWKPGGNLLGMSRDIVSKTLKRGTDKYGRWAWMALQRTKKLTLGIIQLYVPI